MRICYFTLNGNTPTRDIVYLKGLKENGAKIIECRDSSPSLRKFYNLYKKHRALKDHYDIMFVGYSGHILVPFARLLSRKKVVFNALSSLYEGMILSRERRSKISPYAAYCWLIDFLAFHCATVSLVESNSQKEFLKKFFLLSDKKLLRSWTGADPELFYYDPSIPRLPKFTVLFRGAFLPESGIEYFIEATNILKNEAIDFRIIGNGMRADNVNDLINKYSLNNIEWIKDRLPWAQLRKKMQECHLSVGQLSNHSRLERTIPHKAFESLALKLPYLTARSKAIMELLEENKTCFGSTPANATELAKTILFLRNDPAQLNTVAEGGYKLHEIKLLPKILAKKILPFIND